MQLTAAQQARFDDWAADCRETHPAFAKNVVERVLPKQLAEKSAAEIDTWLADLERSLSAMRGI